MHEVNTREFGNISGQGNGSSGGHRRESVQQLFSISGSFLNLGQGSDSRCERYRTSLSFRRTQQGLGPDNLVCRIVAVSILGGCGHKL